MLPILYCIHALWAFLTQFVPKRGSQQCNIETWNKKNSKAVIYWIISRSQNIVILYEILYIFIIIIFIIIFFYKYFSFSSPTERAMIYLFTYFEEMKKDDVTWRQILVLSFGFILNVLQK